MSNFTKNELWPTFPKMILGHPGDVLQSFRPTGYSCVNDHVLISSQSMLIYHSKVKTSCISETAARIANNNDIFDPKGLM